MCTLQSKTTILTLPAAIGMLLLILTGLQFVVAKESTSKEEFLQRYKDALLTLKSRFENFTAKGVWTDGSERADFVVYKRGDLLRLDLMYTQPEEEAGDQYHRVVNGDRSFGVRLSPSEGQDDFYLDARHESAKSKLEHIQANFPGANPAWQFFETSVLELLTRSNLTLDISQSTDDKLVVDIATRDPQSNTTGKPYYEIVFLPKNDLAIKSYRFSGKPMAEQSGVERVVEYETGSNGQLSPKSVTTYNHGNEGRSQISQVLYTSFDFTAPNKSRFEVSDFGFDNEWGPWAWISGVLLLCLLGSIFAYKAVSRIRQ